LHVTGPEDNILSRSETDLVEILLHVT